MSEGRSELELDRIFAAAMRDQKNFRAWFLSAIGLGDAYEMIWDDKWHQRWYRCPETKRDSETDIFLRFRRKLVGDVVGVHIENKPPWGKFRSLQAEDYARRSAAMAERWDYQTWITVILAPRSFLEANPESCQQFNHSISYEAVEELLPDFGVA